MSKISSMQVRLLARPIIAAGLAIFLLFTRSNAQDVTSASAERILQLEKRIAELEKLVTHLRAQNHDRDEAIKET